MKTTMMISALAGLVFGPAMVLAHCGEKPCGASPCASASPCAAASPCAKASPCATPCKPVKCCQKVAVNCPVEKTHCRLVKTEACVPKTHTKCVKDACNPCGESRQVTWTTYHHKTSYHWERYTTVENKTKYVKRCSEQPMSASAGVPAQTVAVAN